MERQPVQSSNIAEVGYDSASKTLEVAFHNGNVFRYQGVAPEEHVRLLGGGLLPGAPDPNGKASVGKYFHSAIRSRYPAVKVEPVEAAAE